MAVVSDEPLLLVAICVLSQWTADQKIPQEDKEGYTLVLAMRRWEFAAVTALRC